MKNWKKKLRSLGLVTLASTLLFTVGCGNSSSTSPSKGEQNEATAPETKKEGGIVRATIGSEPDFLDPHLSAASDTEAIMNNVFEGLIGFTPDGAFVPQIAKEYSVSPDGLTYTFTIRDDITFHNGKTLTPKDVVYSYKRLAGLLGDKALSLNA